MEILEIKGSIINHHYALIVPLIKPAIFRGVGPFKFPDFHHVFHPRHSAHRSMGSRGKTQPEGVVAVVVRKGSLTLKWGWTIYRGRLGSLGGTCQVNATANTLSISKYLNVLIYNIVLYMFLQNANMFRTLELIRLMEEILHHLACMKPVNNRIFTGSTCAGCFPPNIFKSTCSSAHCLLHQKVLSLTHASPRNKL